MKLASKTIAILLLGGTACTAGTGVETRQGQKRTYHHAPQAATVAVPDLTVR
jgi:hypothetical protein